ncbi:MAG: (2Fe-2S)-binding protein [Nitrospirales bacterium]|nr:(2Fe-2S)-binding protein [Nitrospirales bacterium]
MTGNISVSFFLNDELVTVDCRPLRRLLDILRDDLSITSVKEGCGEGECGACSVIFNGRLCLSCLIPASQLQGADVLTIEGVLNRPEGPVLTKAFVKEGGVQCGYCTPGFVLAGYLFLRSPGMDTKDAIDGNLCRCTGYHGIIRALERARDEISKA